MLKKNFTKKDLTSKLHQKIGFSKNFTSSIIDNFFESLISELTNSNKIKISSFGTFKVIYKKERLGRNPKTKVEAKICSRKVVNFKPSSSIKEKINR